MAACIYILATHISFPFYTLCRETGYAADTKKLCIYSVVPVTYPFISRTWSGRVTEKNYVLFCRAYYIWTWHLLSGRLFWFSERFYNYPHPFSTPIPSTQQRGYLLPWLFPRGSFNTNALPQKWTKRAMLPHNMHEPVVLRILVLSFHGPACLWARPVFALIYRLPSIMIIRIRVSHPLQQQNPPWNHPSVAN